MVAKRYIKVKELLLHEWLLNSIIKVKELVLISSNFSLILETQTMEKATLIG